jgi:hypothetical protein
VSIPCTELKDTGADRLGLASGANEIRSLRLECPLKASAYRKGSLVSAADISAPTQKLASEVSRRLFPDGVGRIQPVEERPGELGRCRPARTNEEIANVRLSLDRGYMDYGEIVAGR